MKRYKYQITATIHKAGNPPVKWLYFSDVKLTKTQCEMRFYKPKEAGQTSGESVHIEDFICSEIT
ncbi:DUF1187 family protein [Salmonella enterica]|nr:DUF1187 family protein [Salmonella enterica]